MLYRKAIPLFRQPNFRDLITVTKLPCDLITVTKLPCDIITLTKLPCDRFTVIKFPVTKFPVTKLPTFDRDTGVGTFPCCMSLNFRPLNRARNLSNEHPTDHKMP